MRKFSALLASAILVLAACGGDDDGGGGGGDQDEVADKLLESADDEGLELDEECVRDKASQFSDDDARALLDAEGDETPDLSPEGVALTGQLFSCLSSEAFVDELISSLPEGVDADCVREAMDGVDFSEFGSTGEPPSEFVSAMTECVSG